MLCSYMESNSVLVADGNTTSSAVSPTRRGARPKYVWTAESPTKRVYILARLPNKHNNRRRGYILKTRAWPFHDGQKYVIRNTKMGGEVPRFLASMIKLIWSGTQILQLLLKPYPQVDAVYWFRFLLLCSSPSHQKSVSADDKSKPNKPSPSSPEPTS